jgi:hypothetical protein
MVIIEGWREGAQVGPSGRERRSGAGWAIWGGKEKKKRPVGLGLAGGKGERGKRKREWAEPKEKKREKKKCI